MPAALRKIEDLPRRNATEVKNEWGKLKREARVSGGVVVTHHGEDAMVVMDADRYREMVALAETAQGRRRATIAELSAEFDRHLAQLQARDTHERMDAVLASRGRTRTRPKAGASF